MYAQGIGIRPGSTTLYTQYSKVCWPMLDRTDADACVAVGETNNTTHYRVFITLLFHSTLLYLKSSTIMKIEDVYKYKMALFMFDFSHGRLPLSFDSMFKFTHEIQNYRVTRQSHKIYIPRCKGEFVRKLPYHTLPSAWNIWSELICSDITRNKFKHKLKSTFIDTYLNIVKCSNKQCKDCRA